MQINLSPKQSFTGKNPKVRDADRVMRFANSTFSVLSSTRIEKFDVLKKAENAQYKSIQEKIMKKLKAVRDLQIDEFMDGKPFFTSVLRNLKKHKVGNCGDLSMIIESILAVNNVKNVHRCDLYRGVRNSQGDIVYKEIEHTLITINRLFRKNITSTVP